MVGTTTGSRRLDLRGFVLAAHRPADVYWFLRRKGSFRQVQLFVLFIAQRQFPGLEQNTRLPVGEDLQIKQTFYWLWVNVRYEEKKTVELIERWRMKVKQEILAHHFNATFSRY